MEDLGWGEGFPLTLLSLQPALAMTGRVLLSAPVEERTLSASQSPTSPGQSPRTTNKDWGATEDVQAAGVINRGSLSGNLSAPLPAPSLPLGPLPAGALLQTADEEGQGHSEDDDATHH